MMKLVPLRDKIVVKRLEAEGKTSGGIILPDNAREKPKQGRIVSLGPGGIAEDGSLVPFSVKQGDRVIFSSYAGAEIDVDGEELMIMTEDDLQAVLEE